MTIVNFYAKVKRMNELTKLQRRKLPEQDRSKQTLQAIYQAASELFVANGSDATSMAAIAREVGLTKPALYRYFPNKQALILAMAEAVFLENRQLLEQALRADAPSTKEAMKAGIRQYIELNRHSPFRVILRAATMSNPAVSALEIKEAQINAEMVASYLQNKQGNTQNSMHKKYLTRAFLILELLDSLLRVVLSEHDIDTDAMVDDFIDCFTYDL